MAIEPRPGQRATMKSISGSHTAYIPGKKGTEDTARHGFTSKEVARSYGKHASKSKALERKKK